jgi:hypothetical protein
MFAEFMVESFYSRARRKNRRIAGYVTVFATPLLDKMTDQKAANVAARSISITERNLLVAHGQSKKLSDIRKKFQPVIPVEIMQLKDVKPEVATELGKARQLIDARINKIMSNFPEGKKNKLFSFRFGSLSALKLLSVKAIFKKLNIDETLVKMKLIADMNCHDIDVTSSNNDLKL